MLSHFKSAAVNSLIYTFGNLSTKIVGLILIPIYTRHLTLSDYGILGVLKATSYAIFLLFGFQLYTGFFRWYWDKDYRDKQKILFFTIMLFLTVVCIAICILFFPFSKDISSLLFQHTKYSYLIQLTVLYSAFLIITHNPGILMRLQEKAFIYMLTSTIRLIINLSLTIILIVKYHHGVEGIFEAQIIGSLIYFLMIIPYMLKNIEFHFDTKLLKDLLIFSSPAILSGISTIIITTTDKYFLNFLSGIDNAGTYAFAYKIANTVNILIAASISMAITPVVYKLINAHNNKRFYAKVMTYTTFILALFSMFFSLFGKEIVKVLSGNPAYWSSYNVIPIICLAIIFSNMRDNVMNGLNIVKRTKTIAYVLIMSSIVNIVLNYLLIPAFSYIGAAMSFLGTHFITMCLMYFYSQKYYPISFENKKIFMIILIYCVFSAVAFIINDMDIIFRIVIKSSLIISFPFILYYMGFYEDIELNQLKGLWMKWNRPGRWINNLKEFK